uniref:bacteriophage T4 gp5 trimerisation domain-containing protein n=2 Tax=Marinomonas TaxID=28253 RepID=UPI003B8A7A02
RKVYLHAQKDMETDVLNDSISHIGHDQHRQIDNDRFTQIGGENGTGNDHLTIKGESRHKIGKDQTISIDGSLQQKVGKIVVLEAGEEIHFKSGDKTVIEAEAEIILAAGGSFVKIDSGGVHMVGAAINLNVPDRAVDLVN